MVLNPSFDPLLLSRVEDAGLNASAVPQQRWSDGWLVRLAQGKAKRTRCINALCVGRQPLDAQLREAHRLFAAAGLPVVVRITPFTQPAVLDAQLDERGWRRFDETRVMLLASLAAFASPDTSPGIEPVDSEAFATLVGALRGSPEVHRQAHAERLRHSPVRFEGFRLIHDHQVVACGQIAVDGEVAGLYDVFTAAWARGRGHGITVCRQLLQHAWHRGASTAYLQVEADNAPARAVYRRLGFVDAYAYHYRAPDGAPT